MPVVVSNGKRVGADYRTVINNEGAVFHSSNGRRLSSLNRWGKMSWNGHMFAPPPSGSVLYYPGIPGVGSTIYDFSWNFSDSGINTAEALDISETAIDVSADPTTAIPVGSIIRIDSELMYVTASAEPLVVIRGYKSVAATHDNTKDIFVWVPNNGTITGAAWGQLPSGLPYLSFDGSDDQIAIPAQSMTDITALVWLNPTIEATVRTFFDIGNLLISIENITQKISVNREGAGSVVSDTALDGTWQLVGVVINGANTLFYLNGEADGSQANTTFTAGSSFIGRYHGAGQFYDGGLAIPRLSDAAFSATLMAEIYQQERHLFGV